MKRLFVDTSAWFAYAHRHDRDHACVRAALRGFTGRLVTSNYVLDETVTLCRYRLGHAAAVAVGGALREDARIDLLRIAPEDEEAAWGLFVSRADQRYSYTDCTSFVLMRRLGIDEALALDEDFVTEGFVTIPG